MTYLLGVDLGTTFTAAAVANGGRPSMVGLGIRAPQIPSVLYLAEDGFLVGEAAERRGAVDPSRVVREFKRRLGDPVPLLIAGAPYSAEVLTARLLRWVVEKTIERMGEPPDGLVVTNPANWGPFKLEVLGQVVALADVGPARWCAEPVAAAAQYAAREHVPPGTKLAVYDLGGGTFDVCVLEKTVNGFVMLGSPEGVEHLGGVDFDEALFRHVVESVDPTGELADSDDPAVAVRLALLRRDCVDAKEALSADQQATIPISLPGRTGTFQVRQATFEGLIRPALEETLSAMERGLRSAGIHQGGLDAIVLVGGSSRIPLVAELLSRRFGARIALDTHPKHDVALGAVQLDLAEATIPRNVPGETTMLRPSESQLPTPTPSPDTAHPPDSGGQAGPAAAAAFPPQVPPRPLSPASPRTLGPAPATPAATPAGGAGSASAADWPASVATAAAEPQSITEPAGARRRPRAVALVALGVVVVLAGVLVGLGVHAIQTNNSGPRTGPGPATTRVPTGGGTSSARPSGLPSASSVVPSSPSLPALPQSVPLAATELIVPMKVHGNWNLYLADTEKRAPVRQLTKADAIEYGQALSPDSRTVVYLYDEDPADDRRTLWVAGAADGSDPRPLFSHVPSVCNATMYRPAWSRSDPGLLAIPCSNKAGHLGLYLIRTDGTVVREIRLPGDAVDDPAFSPDGKQLAFWSGPDRDVDGGSIYVETVDKSAPQRRLTRAALAGQDGDPVWSPDGKSIAFRRLVADGTVGGNADIFITRADGSGNPKRLTRGSGQDQDPSYSPDGSQIAYQSSTPTSDWPGPATARAWVMDRDGSHQRVLWTKSAPDKQVSPSWSAR
jgi:molecular chaperone DnaK